MEKISLNITGMVCGGCSGTVRQALLGLDGVIEAEVSHVDAKADVTFDPAKITSSRIISAIQAAGYQAV